MDGVMWEIKFPEGSGKRTIENTIKKPKTQSSIRIYTLTPDFGMNTEYCIIISNKERLK